VHHQDFLPLRERLRELGVHFLVHAALDQDSLRLFLLQLLYNGPNPRKELRLPLGDRIDCGVVGAPLEVGKLVDLTSGMCRIISPSAAEPGETMRIVLPESLGGKEQFEVQGPVLRSVESESRAGDPAFSILVKFDALEGEERAQIDRLVRGEQIGTRVTPLAERPRRKPGLPVAEPAAQAPEPSVPVETAQASSHQRQPRWEYRERVDVLDFDDLDASQTALGRDLSLGGVRIVGQTGLEVGAVVTLALYSGPRQEPVVLEATVLRDDGSRGLALVFNSVSDGQMRELERICSTLPPLESLHGAGEEPDRVVFAQVTSARR
jgi:hypothetical protein